MTNKTWREFFPLKQPRKEQEYILDRIVEKINSGEKTFILEAGTGVGKSAIAVCLANYITATITGFDKYKKGAYILTSQKILQDQYLRDYKSACDIRSSSNFSCHSGPGETCGQTIRYNIYSNKKEKDQQKTCPNCPYRNAKDNFISAPLGITNYSYFMSETVYAGEIEPRKLLVLDEAHNIESEMRRWSTVEIDEETVNNVGCEFPFNSSRNDIIDWLTEIYKPTLVSHVLSLSDRLESLESKGIKKGISSLIDELDKMDKHMCAVNRIFDDEMKIDRDMLMDWSEQQNGRRKLQIQPLESGKIAKDMLYTLGEYNLLMSATILSSSIFKKSVGIDNCEFVSQPTPFPPKNFGLVYKPVGKMSKAFISKTMPKMINAVKEILKKHPLEKGIIHCANYDITKAIASINDRRLLIQTTAKDREDILKRHREGVGPTVIVSPSMMEGLDLEGDLGRFQIICKIPFPNMGDPVVEARNKQGDSWYAWYTSKSLIQSVGRCVRSITDTTNTYILDESFGVFFEKWGQMFPSYFGELEIDI